MTDLRLPTPPSRPYGAGRVGSRDLITTREWVAWRSHTKWRMHRLHVS